MLAMLNGTRGARRAVRLSGTVLGLCLCAGQAMGQASKALDRMPTDAIVVVTTPSLERLDKNASNLMTAAELPGMSTPSQLMGIIGLRDGLDMSGSMALALMPGDMGGDLPPVVMLLPVSDYGAMLKGFGATPGEGVTQIMAAGETLWARQVDGGFAAVGPIRELIEKFDDAPGKGEAHLERLGPTGRAALEDSDIAAIFDVPAFMATFGEGVNPLGGAMQQMFAGGGLVGNPADSMSPMMEAIKRDASFGVIGMRAAGLGATLDLAVQFRDGTEMSNAAQAGGNSTGLLSALPDDPFLVAFAVDASTPGMRQLIRTALSQGEAQGNSTSILLGMVDTINAQAGVIYPNPGGLFAGAIARGIMYYEAADASKFKTEFQGFLEKINGSDDGTTTTTTSYAPGAATISGVTADSYGVKLGFSGGRGGSPMMMFYGAPGGPSGHIAAAGRGVYMTTTPDQALMTKAIAAAQGGGKTLGANPQIETIGTMLPPSRTFEVYVGVKPIMDQVAAILAMAQRPLAAPVPADTPPIGAGVVVGGGGLRTTVMIPTPVIKVGMSLRETFAAPQGQPGAAPADQRPKF